MPLALALALGLIVAFFLVCRLFFLKLPKRKLIKIGVGVLFTYVGFGVVALVAMTPLITIQLLGFRAIVSGRVKERKAMERMLDAVMNRLEDKFATIRNGKGISFAVPLSSVIGVNLYQFLSNNRLKKGGGHENQ